MNVFRLLAALVMMVGVLAPVNAQTIVKWLESADVEAPWQGENLHRVIDMESGQPCLEWYQDPATKGEATLTLSDVDPANFDALRLQWKHHGGGAGLAVTIGKRNWYLFKDTYQPDIWRDTWLQLDLDDDGGGEMLQPDGTLQVRLRFFNLPQNREGEEAWRRVRVRNLCLVKFPVQLSCDPKAVTYEEDEESLRTIFPMQLVNTTEQEQTVELMLDPASLRHFSAGFAQTQITLPAGAVQIVPYTFTIDRQVAEKLEPLYIEETPVYARVKGDPDSLTTWFRAFVQWRPGGVVPPRRLAHPRMIDHDVPRRLRAMAEQEPLARQALDKMLDVDDALNRPIFVPELRHGYSGTNICPEHQKPVQFDLEELRRHWCPTGKHHVEGVERLDRAAALTVHTRNSKDCARLGWAYFLTGNEKYAQKARELLVAYADRYPEWDYAKAGATGYWSRVAHAVLGESWWIHGFVDGYDMIGDSPSLSAADKNAIATRFFAVASESIQSHRVEKNQQCEINWASGGAAINAGAWYLAAMRFGGTFGLRDMVELSFSEEGFSRENEFPYHYSAMLPIVDQGVAWEALGASFFDARVKRIFDAPLAFSIDQRLGWSGVYEVGYRHYRDPDYLPQLNRTQFSHETLVHGVMPLPESEGSGDLGNSTLPLAGKTTLRRGTADALRAVQISWGAPTWRGGQDMFNSLVNFDGIFLNRSVTRIGYGYSIHGLSYDTLAGNLVQVDGLNQTGVRPQQTALLEGDVAAAQYVAPFGATLYPGVRQTRVVAIAGDVFIFIDRLVADRTRRFDLSWYPSADAVKLMPELTMNPYPALTEEGAGYGAIQDCTIGKAPATVVLDYQAAHNKRQIPARIHILSGREGELIQAQTHTGWHPFLTPLIMVRTQAESATYVTVLEAGETELPVASIERLPVVMDAKELPFEAAIAVRVTLTDGRVYLLIDSDPELSGERQAGGVTTDRSLWGGLVE